MSVSTDTEIHARHPNPNIWSPSPNNDHSAYRSSPHDLIDYDGLTPLESPAEELEEFLSEGNTRSSGLNNENFHFPAGARRPSLNDLRDAQHVPLYVRTATLVPSLPRRRSYHHLSSPPPPLSARLQHRSSHFSFHTHSRRASDADHTSYHPYAFAHAKNAASTPSQLEYGVDISAGGRRNSLQPGSARHPEFSAIGHYPHRSSARYPSSATTTSSDSTSSPITPSSGHLHLPMPLSTKIETICPSALSNPNDPSAEEPEERPWDLVPYHIPWGPNYYGYKSGTLPGPDGKSFFFRSPTPTKNHRTTQACEKCRERKAKCSGTRPSCARCIHRGHVCEYGPDLKKSADPPSPTPTPPPPSAIGESSPEVEDGTLSPKADKSDAPNSQVKAETNEQLRAPTAIHAVPVQPIFVNSHAVPVSYKKPRRLPDRTNRSRASAPNLRAKAASMAAANKYWVKQEPTPINIPPPPPMPNIAGIAAIKAKFDAQGPAPLTVVIPTLPRNVIPSSGLRTGTSPADVNSPLVINPTALNQDQDQGTELEVTLDQEMTTPAPNTAVFAQPQPESFQRRPTTSGGYPLDSEHYSSGIASASSSGIPSPRESLASIDSYVDAGPHQIDYSMQHGFGHGLRSSTSMPHLHSCYAGDVIDGAHHLQQSQFYPNDGSEMTIYTPQSEYDAFSPLHSDNQCALQNFTIGSPLENPQQQLFVDPSSMYYPGTHQPHHEDTIHGQHHIHQNSPPQAVELENWTYQQ